MLLLSSIIVQEFWISLSNFKLTCCLKIRDILELPHSSAQSLFFFVRLLFVSRLKLTVFKKFFLIELLAFYVWFFISMNSHFLCAFKVHSNASDLLKVHLKQSGRKLSKNFFQWQYYHKQGKIVVAIENEGNEGNARLHQRAANYGRKPSILKFRGEILKKWKRFLAGRWVMKCMSANDVALWQTHRNSKKLLWKLFC